MKRNNNNSKPCIFCGSMRTIKVVGATPCWTLPNGKKTFVPALWCKDTRGCERRQNGNC